MRADIERGATELESETARCEIERDLERPGSSTTLRGMRSPPPREALRRQRRVSG